MWLAISRAASERAALACCGATVHRYAACSWIADTMRGCWWPMLVNTSWEVKSSSRCPSWSHTWEPSALVTTIGSKEAWADQEWKTCLRSSSRDAVGGQLDELRQVLSQTFCGNPSSRPPCGRLAGSIHRVVTTLPRVKKCTPSAPWAWVSPSSDRFQPPKE